MNADLASRLDNFLEQLFKPPQDSRRALYDEQWPSPCVIDDSPKDGDQIHWRPVRQDPASDMFQRLEQALEVSLHPDIALWYTRYWSDSIPAHHSEGDLTLLFCWNEEDVERLRGNLLGHLMAKQKQRQPLTLFFACTDGEEFMTVDNEDGSVWLERPGKKPIRRLADSLAEFLDALAPIAEAD